MKINTINSYYQPKRNNISFKNNNSNDIVTTTLPAQDVTQFTNISEVAKKPAESFAQRVVKAVGSFINSKVEDPMDTAFDMSDLATYAFYKL